MNDYFFVLLPLFSHPSKTKRKEGVGGGDCVCVIIFSMIDRSVLQQFSDSNKKSMNLSEIRIWLVLKNSLYNFRRQKIIGNYIVDFVSLRNKIIVEIDGNSHENKIEYDEARIKYLIESGYKVMIVRQKINFPSEELKKFIFDEIEKLMKDVLVVKII